jgi:hypothetical protein
LHGAVAVFEAALRFSFDADLPHWAKGSRPAHLFGEEHTPIQRRDL